MSTKYLCVFMLVSVTATVFYLVEFMSSLSFTLHVPEVSNTAAWTLPRQFIKVENILIPRKMIDLISVVEDVY